MILLSFPSQFVFFCLGGLCVFVQLSLYILKHQFFSHFPQKHRGWHLLFHPVYSWRSARAPPRRLGQEPQRPSSKQHLRFLQPSHRPPLSSCTSPRPPCSLTTRFSEMLVGTISHCVGSLLFSAYRCTNYNYIKFYSNFFAPENHNGGYDTRRTCNYGS